MITEKNDQNWLGSFEAVLSIFALNTILSLLFLVLKIRYVFLLSSTFEIQILERNFLIGLQDFKPLSI